MSLYRLLLTGVAINSKEVSNIVMTVTNVSFVKQGVTREGEVVSQQPPSGPTSGLGPSRALLETVQELYD
jgi:hypothetical protein